MSANFQLNVKKMMILSVWHFFQKPTFSQITLKFKNIGCIIFSNENIILNLNS